MANQMIALQSRNPQLPDPSRGAAQFANMMNMASQQRASQLQAERIRQEMEFARAKEGREVDMQAANIREKELDIEDKELLRLYKMGAAILETEDPTAREAAYQNLLGLIEDTSPQLGATMRQVAGTFNPQVLQSVMVPVVDHFNKKYATPTTETAFGPNDEILEVTKGGLPGVAGVRPLLNMPAQGAPTAAARATPTAAAPSGSARTGKFGEALVVPDSARPLTADQQDHIRRMQEDLGMTNTPASFSAGASAAQMTPQRAQQIVDAAVNTRVMAQEDFDQLIALTPEQNKQPFMEMIQANNIKLQPGGMGQQPQFAVNQGQRPQADFAVNRGATPAATLAQTNVVGQQAYGRSGSPTSPIPGSSLVAPQVLGSQKAAETAGAENVKVGTEPRIVAGTERAKRLEKLRGEMPIAQAETQTLVNSLTGRINAIDEYLRSGSRNSIIGTIEGRIPKFLQSETRADAQGLYDYITSNTVLQKLIDDRGQTETGGSPQGVVSDADLKVAAQASTKLTQTGSERKQEIEMQRLRDELYRTREQAIQKYNNVYREVMKEAPELRLKVRTVAPKYKSAPQTPTRAKSLQNIFGG